MIRNVLTLLFTVIGLSGLLLSAYATCALIGWNDSSLAILSLPLPFGILPSVGFLAMAGEISNR